MAVLKFISLQNFRNYQQLELQLEPGLTLLIGNNGSGKTNLIEAICFLARGEPLRSVPLDALIKNGAPEAIVRGEFESGASASSVSSGVVPERIVSRKLLVEAQLPQPPRKLRLQVNRQKVSRKADLRSLISITDFLPGHLSVVQGSPQGRRDFLDDVAAATVNPASSKSAWLKELPQILRQRNALLRQAKGRLTPQGAAQLDIWDEKLSAVVADCIQHRLEALTLVQPYAEAAYREIADQQATLSFEYVRSWEAFQFSETQQSSEAQQFREALTRARHIDVARGLTTVGPHRDDVSISLNGLPSRSHASQGEQRTLAVALRLSLHRVHKNTSGVAPLLLLDDVLSELDQERGRRFLNAFTSSDVPATSGPATQILITSATPLPPYVNVDNTFAISQGHLSK